MLRIRNAQMRAFQADWIQRVVAPMILTRLREGGYIEDPASGRDDAERDEDDPEEIETARAVPDGEEPLPPTAEELFATVVEEIERALADRIDSDDGVLQYVSYRFMLHPGWQDDPEVRFALSRLGETEEERLAEVHRLVAGG